MTETEIRFLRRLKAASDSGLRRSVIPPGCRQMVEALQTCGAAEFRPASSGRGIAFRITDFESFERFIGSRLPGGLDVDLDAISDRATAVSLLGDAKAVRQSVAQGIFVRSVRPDVAIHAADGVVLPVTRLTHDAGGACIELSPKKSWKFAGTIAVVENADVFWRHDAVVGDIELAIHASGPMSRRLISWLASSDMGKCKITHWGDYDPVGVCEYLRLAEACPGRVESYAPKEVDSLLPRIGKRVLIIKQATYLDKLRNKLDDPYVRRMVRLFDIHRRGLEQEIFLRERKDIAASARFAT